MGGVARSQNPKNINNSISKNYNKHPFLYLEAYYQEKEQTYFDVLSRHQFSP